MHPPLATSPQRCLADVENTMLAWTSRVRLVSRCLRVDVQMLHSGDDLLSVFSDGNLQQDPSEFLGCLLSFVEDASRVEGASTGLTRLRGGDAVLKGMPAAQRAPAKAVMKGLEQQRSCALSDLIRHSVVETTACAGGHAGTRHDSRICLQVPLQQDGGDSWWGEAPETLQQAVQRAFAAQALPDSLCTAPGCKHRQSRHKHEAVCLLPQLLAVHIMRFAFDAASCKVRKVETPLEVLEWLDVAPVCNQAVMDALALSDGGFSYRLTAVCHHDGRDAHCGHYWATCRNAYDGVWRRYNDTDVREATCPAGVDTTGYLLFYERVQKSV